MCPQSVPGVCEREAEHLPLGQFHRGELERWVGKAEAFLRGRRDLVNRYNPDEGLGKGPSISSLSL